MVLKIRVNNSLSYRERIRVNPSLHEARSWSSPVGGVDHSTTAFTGLPRSSGQPCRKGTLSSIARTPSAVGSRRHATTGGQRSMTGKLLGYARVSVSSDADANNLENQRRVLADCEQVFEDVGSGASWNRPGLNA